MAKNNVKPKKTCVNCNRTLVETNFYKCESSPLFPDGRFHLCTKCLGEMMDGDDGYDITLMALHAMNKPFLEDVFNSCEHPRDYFRQINSLPQYRNTTWKNSIFSSDGLPDSKDNEDEAKLEITHIDLDMMQSKWGSGYTHEEYRLFENKYNTLKHNYPEKTSMHTEALLTYIRYRVKEEMESAKGDVKRAKEWGTLASKAAQDAKINPSQLSQADLTDGLDSVGQIVRATEQVEDIIEVLPKFKEKPRDKVDFAIWCYINYARDLEGKSLVEYDDVYAFYEERKNEYKDEFGFLEEGE